MESLDITKILLETIGLEFNDLKQLNGLIIPREQLLSDAKYEEIKYLIPKLKKAYSSSFMTSLQNNADKVQKWPLLNLVRQILHVYYYNMVPIRKADGYTLEGVKKYKRYFQIVHKKTSNTNTNTNTNIININKIESNNSEELIDTQ